MSRIATAPRALLLVVVAGCATLPEQPVEEPAAESTVTFHAGLGDVTVTVEVAADFASRANGLMWRKSLPPLAGMLFVFPREEEHRFWMKNTYLPLDMIFLDEERLVVGVVAEAEPLTEESRTIGAPSKYVVEVNGGFAARHGIETGTRAALHAAPLDTSR